MPLGGYTNDTLLCSKKYESPNTLVEAEDHYLNYGHDVQIEAGLDYYPLDNLAMEFSFSLTGGLPLIKVKSRQTTDNSTEIIFEKDSENNPAPIRIPGSNLGLRIGIRLQIIKMEREQGVY